MRTQQDIVQAVEMYADTVLRVCSIYLRQQADRDDAFQETFLKYSQADTEFADEGHRKAWLIRVASNVCKDQLRRTDSKNVPLDELEDEHPVAIVDDEAFETVQAHELLKALNMLKEQYKIALYMKYYEQYTAVQIADQLGIPENTVYTNLARGREQLKEVLMHGQAR